MGAPLTLRHSELDGLRKWLVKDFDNVLIFYLPYPNGVLIVRVLHAAYDWWSLLGIRGPGGGDYASPPTAKGFGAQYRA